MATLLIQQLENEKIWKKSWLLPCSNPHSHSYTQHSCHHHHKCHPPSFWCQEVGNPLQILLIQREIKLHIGKLITVRGNYIRNRLEICQSKINSCLVAGPMGQMNPRPSVWCSKYYFFSWFLAEFFAKILSLYLFIFLKKYKNKSKEFWVP